MKKISAAFLMIAAFSSVRCATCPKPMTEQQLRDACEDLRINDMNEDSDTTGIVPENASLTGYHQ